MPSVAFALLILLCAIGAMIVSYKADDLRMFVDIGFAFVLFHTCMLISPVATNRSVWGIHLQPSVLTDHPTHMAIKSVTAYAYHAIFIGCALYICLRIWMIATNPMTKDVASYAWQTIRERRFAEALQSFRTHFSDSNSAYTQHVETPETFEEWSRQQMDQAWREFEWQQQFDAQRNGRGPKGANRQSSAPVQSEREFHLMTLNLKLGATARDIKKAYRAQARKYHPDVMIASGASDADIDQAQTNMQEINFAYDWLEKNAA